MYARNVLLFSPAEAARAGITLGRDDARARHIHDQLKSSPGDLVRIGVVNGLKVLPSPCPVDCHVCFSLIQPVSALAPVHCAMSVPRLFQQLFQHLFQPLPPSTVPCLFQHLLQPLPPLAAASASSKHCAATLTHRA